MKKRNPISRIALLLLGLLLINFLSYQLFERFDLTSDKRYTLSAATEEIIAAADKPVVIDVFLKGDFPPEFLRLQRETRYLLEEFAAISNNIKFNFVNPLADGGDANAIATDFYEMGMTPARINVVENGRTTEAIVFPWAIANYGNETVKVPLLENALWANTEERVESSVQQLEYAFADAIRKLVLPKEKKIAVMRGNGELGDRYIADLLRSLQDYYYIAPFTLDSVAQNPRKTLDQLREYDLIIEAKPTEAYSEEEKLVLDQYLMSGGKQLWLLDRIAMENDSLFNAASTAFAIPSELNLGDYFFKYGIRINPVLVKDLYSAPIVLATGSGNQTQFDPFPWFYLPLAVPSDEHAIVSNVSPVKFEYSSQIDTLANQVQKTVLLSSSPRTMLEGVPVQISLDQLSNRPDPERFTAGPQPLAVLLEGEFTSVYKNRVLPFEPEEFLEESVPTKMIVISDGDVIRNQVQQGQPLELGFDRYTGTTYGNKEFLLNAVNYLLEDSGLMEVRSKEVSIAFLDREEVSQSLRFWQGITIALPLIMLLLFWILYRLYRRKRYLK